LQYRITCFICAIASVDAVPRPALASAIIVGVAGTSQ
jgi:hypothetical protein